MTKLKIDFCVVGPQRTGSTWLYNLFNKYNICCLPKEVKETYYFDRYYSEGLDYYTKFFKCANKQIVGEIATTYFDNIDCIARLHNHNPDCKIVIIYRNPLDRAISLINHHRRKGRIDTDILDGIKRYPSIIEGGRYSKWIPLWQEYFKKNNVKVLNYNLLVHDPQNYLNDVLQFLSLGVIVLNKADMSSVNEASSPKSVILAKYAAIASENLRKIGLNKVVNMGKKIGLNKVYAGGRIDDIGKIEKQKISSFFSEKDYFYE